LILGLVALPIERAHYFAVRLRRSSLIPKQRSNVLKKYIQNIYVLNVLDILKTSRLDP